MLTAHWAHTRLSGALSRASPTAWLSLMDGPQVAAPASGRTMPHRYHTNHSSPAISSTCTTATHARVPPAAARRI